MVERYSHGYKCRNDPRIGRGLVVHADGRWYGGERWLHVAVAGGEIPAHAELLGVKKAFLGEDRYAYQVFPPARCYVNLAPTQLHLWSPVDRPPLPEFSGGYDLL